MKRWYLACWLLCFSLAPAYAWWQSVAQQSVGPPPSYTGPGDVVSGARFWYGLRCYNSAYNGNVADVYAPADASHTLITCSTGGVLNETLQALSITCAVSCTVKTLYDQTGGNNCTAATCDLSNATIGNRPAFTLNCIGSLPCMTFTSASSQVLLSATNLTSTAQPNTFSAIAQTTNTAAARHLIGTNGGSANQIGYPTTNNTVHTFAGINLTGTASASSYHAFQAVLNGASSVMSVDGSFPTGNAGASAMSNIISLGAINASQFMSGQILEAGAWNGVAFSSGQATSMSSNQHAYWGF